MEAPRDLKWVLVMLAWMLATRPKLFLWRQTKRTSWWRRAGIPLHPRCAMLLLVRRKRVALLCKYQLHVSCCWQLRDAPSDLRRASRRFFSSSSFDARIDLTAGMKADFLRFPLLSFNAGASSSPRPPGPMLLLRALREDLAGDVVAALGFALATRPSAMFPFPSVAAILKCCGGVCWWCFGRMRLR